MAELNASIADKKYFIIKNPDGTYMHCTITLITEIRFQNWRIGLTA